MSEDSELQKEDTPDFLAQSASAMPYLQFASILLKGLERVVEIQKSTLDLYDKYSEQAGDAAASIKQAFPIIPIPLFEIAEQAIREFLQLQVRILDLMMSQSVTQIEAMKADPTQDYQSNIAKLMRDSAECLLTVQKKAVEFITQQNQSFSMDMIVARGNENLNGAAEIMCDAEAVVQAQKKFWDATLKPFKALNAI